MWRRGVCAADFDILLTVFWGQSVGTKKGKIRRQRNFWVVKFAYKSLIRRLGRGLTLI
jgi:hypothetical protein